MLWSVLRPTNGTVDEVLSVVAVMAALAVLVWAAALIRGVKRAGVFQRDRAADRRQMLITLAGGAVIGLGTWLLSVTGQTAYVPALVAAVIGAHLVPLAAVLGLPTLRNTGWYLCIVAAALAIMGLIMSGVPSGPVLGVMIASMLLTEAFTILVRARRGAAARAGRRGSPRAPGGPQAPRGAY